MASRGVVQECVCRGVMDDENVDGRRRRRRLRLRRRRKGGWVCVRIFGVCVDGIACGLGSVGRRERVSA